MLSNGTDEKLQKKNILHSKTFRQILHLLPPSSEASVINFTKKIKNGNTGRYRRRGLVQEDNVSLRAANCSSPREILSAISLESTINFAFIWMKCR